MRLIAPPERADLYRGLDRRLGADALEHGVRAVATGQFQDAFDALLAARGDDIGRAELAAQVGALRCLPIRMICSAPSRLAASTPHSPTAPSPMTVTRVAGAYPGGDRAVVAGAVDVGQRQQ